MLPWGTPAGIQIILMDGATDLDNVYLLDMYFTPLGECHYTITVESSHQCFLFNLILFISGDGKEP